MIRINCPGCKTLLQVDERHQGAVLSCPKCKQAFRVPAPSAAAPEGTWSVPLHEQSAVQPLPKNAPPEATWSVPLDEQKSLINRSMPPEKGEVSDSIVLELTETSSPSLAPLPPARPTSAATSASAQQSSTSQPPIPSSIRISQSGNAAPSGVAPPLSGVNPPLSGGNPPPSGTWSVPVADGSGSSSSSKDVPVARPDNDELIRILAPAQQADKIGRLGGYRVLKLLGCGGMGRSSWRRIPA
jgi:uncharacterized Zn finger protein (UPF0148 family)